MTQFTRRWLFLAIIGIVLNPIVFAMGAYNDLMTSMAPDEPFDQKPASSLQEATTRFEGLSDTARRLYQSHLVWDVPFFLSMGLASASLLLLAWGPWRTKRTYCLVLFFTASFVVCDAIENAFIAMWFSGDGPTLTTTSILSFVTPAKFGSILLTLPVLLLGIGLRFWKRQPAPIQTP